jgi:hypothetical protein
MMRPYRPRSTREALASFQFALGTVARPSPFVIAWRWRYELGLTAGLPLAVIGLVHAVGAGWAIGVIAALAHAIVLWPAARRLLVAQAWCVITAHRVRTGCAQAWIHSRTGKIPIVRGDQAPALRGAGHDLVPGRHIRRGLHRRASSAGRRVLGPRRAGDPE